MTLEEIVEHYILNYRNAARNEMRVFAKKPDLATAIHIAALCKLSNGKRHPHQRRIPKRVLQEAERRLQAASKQMTKCPSFDSLYRLIEAIIGDIHGIGELTVYDITHRIGAYLEKTPALIYLHAGTRSGAGILGYRGKTIDPKRLPKALSRLLPAEIEDCLCIYKDCLQVLGSKKTISQCHKLLGTNAASC